MRNLCLLLVFTYDERAKCGYVACRISVANGASKEASVCKYNHAFGFFSRALVEPLL